MGSQSTVTVNFGAYPGDTMCSTIITNETSILSTSLVEAWLWPRNTGDHSVDEHIMLKPYLDVTACSIVAGAGFTIVLSVKDSQFNEDAPHPPPGFGRGTKGNINRDTNTMWGSFYVAYVWN